MPTFVVIFEDDLTAPMPDHLNAEHRAHFLGLGERAILGGPTMTDDGKLSGRLLIGEFPSLEEARAWAASEPLVLCGRVKNWRASPFVVVQDKGEFTAPPGHGG